VFSNEGVDYSPVGKILGQLEFSRVFKQLYELDAAYWKAEQGG
jgi:hypothetical protein